MIFTRGDSMVDGDRLGDVGFKYLGTPYSVMDCQAFVEKCLSDCGYNKNLAGSNAWYRYIMEHGTILTPEECTIQLGCVPKGAILFIHSFDGKEPAKYHGDGKGNASHIGICTKPRGEGAIHSSSSRGCVAESKFTGKSINGGWNEVGLPDFVVYDYGGSHEPDPSGWRPTIRRGSKGNDVAYVQAILADLGYDLGNAGVDGDFGRKTEEAVVAFQKANGLNPDGVVGPLTYAALESADLVVRDELYTVTIPNLTKEDADAIKQAFPDATVSVG